MRTTLRLFGASKRLGVSSDAFVASGVQILLRCVASSTLCPLCILLLNQGFMGILPSLPLLVPLLVRCLLWQTSQPVHHS